MQLLQFLVPKLPFCATKNNGDKSFQEKCCQNVNDFGEFKRESSRRTSKRCVDKGVDKEKRVKRSVSSVATRASG